MHTSTVSTRHGSPSLAQPARRLRAIGGGPVLFVYGTLLPGEAAHHLVAGLVDLGPASISGRLYTLGAYPALGPPQRAAERVYGRLYGRLDKGLLATLDRLEDHRPHAPAHGEYRRVACCARLADGTALRAWAYRYNRPLPAARRLPSGRWRALA